MHTFDDTLIRLRWVLLALTVVCIGSVGFIRVESEPRLDLLETRTVHVTGTIASSRYGSAFTTTEGLVIPNQTPLALGEATVYCEKYTANCRSQQESAIELLPRTILYSNMEWLMFIAIIGGMVFGSGTLMCWITHTNNKRSQRLAQDMRESLKL